jgi:hypothetical protein
MLTRPLSVGLARESEPDEQLAHAVRADRVALVGERCGQLVEAFRHPQQRALGIAPRRRRDQTLEITEQRWIAIGQRSRTAAFTPDPTMRQRRRVKAFKSAPDRRAGEPGNRRDRR